MADPVMAARDLGFSYGSEAVIEGVSLELREGEMVGVVGPNGSGKSTLLRLLSGVLVPKRGEVRIHGRLLQSFSRRALSRAVAVVMTFIVEAGTITVSIW